MKMSRARQHRQGGVASNGARREPRTLLLHLGVYLAPRTACASGSPRVTQGPVALLLSVAI